MARKGYKYVSVDVDVCISEFETEILCDELIDRIESEKGLKESDMIILKASLSQMNDALSGVSKHFNGIEIKSLDDKLKADIIVGAWSKYSLTELEKRLA